MDILFSTLSIQTVLILPLNWAAKMGHRSAGVTKHKLEWAIRKMELQPGGGGTHL